MTRPAEIIQNPFLEFPIILILADLLIIRGRMGQRKKATFLAGISVVHISELAASNFYTEYLRLTLKKSQHE